MHKLTPVHYYAEELLLLTDVKRRIYSRSKSSF